MADPATRRENRAGDMTDDNDVLRSLGRIEGTLEAIDKNLKKLNGRLDHHSGRIGKLERWQATLAGVAVVAGLVIGGFIRKMFS